MAARRLEFRGRRDRAGYRSRKLCRYADWKCRLPARPARRLPRPDGVRRRSSGRYGPRKWHWPEGGRESADRSTWYSIGGSKPRGCDGQAQRAGKKPESLPGKLAHGRGDRFDSPRALLPPAVQLRLERINRAAFLMGMTVDRQTFGAFPTLHGSGVAPEIRGDGFPGIEAPAAALPGRRVGGRRIGSFARHKGQPEESRISHDKARHAVI